jgi:hypothetical protein
MAYFAFCIFVSAFLIFQVQPMIARFILPWFGGTPAVWSTVQMFFQVLLTGGYAYASWVTGRGRRRGMVHLVLLGFSAAVMILLGFIWKSPITPDASWRPQASSFPIWEIVKLLAVSVGLPYFLLSSNSPLMQAWFHRAFPEKTAYRLYALSNIGSLLGLVTYPVLIEPYLTLAWQGWLWSLLYLVYAGLAAYGTARALVLSPVGPAFSRTVPGNRHAESVTYASQDDTSDSRQNPPPAGAPLETGPASSRTVPGNRHAESVTYDGPKVRDAILWVSLAATASILLLSVTSHLTQEVAVIPFLWVLPLTIYLLTFILAFSGERWYSRQFYLATFFIATLLYAWVVTKAGTISVPAQIGIFGMVLFLGCMVCHGELYALRPHPSRLTVFYLLVSVGGALGGLLINFAAPYVFRGYWELPVGFVLCWLLFLVVFLLDRRKESAHRFRFIVNSALLLSALAIVSARAVQYIRADYQNMAGLWRNFYGVVRIRREVGGDSTVKAYDLVHGITVHGLQFTDPELRDLPTTYYSPTGGVGLVLLNHPRRGQGLRVGVLGLGIGTVSAYGQPGDVYRFYEINPQVIRLAEGEGGYFSFLKDSQAQVEVVEGDARLSIERELSTGEALPYDVLVLDVFSSDSIPVHLLDAESFDLYLKYLAPGGILAVHISNRSLDLLPVVWTLADHYQLDRVVIQDTAPDAPGAYPSLWVLLSRDASLLQIPAIAGHALPMEEYVSHVPLWTDDYSNLFQILKH